MKTGRKTKSIRMVDYGLVLFASFLLVFHNSSRAGEKSNVKNQLEPVVTLGATVRGLTKPFEATIDDKKIYFENGLQFVGQVIWLDEYSLDLRARDSQVYVKIPLDAVTKLEMKLEKKNWPVASGTLIGLAIGAGVPADKDSDKNIRSLQRMILTASGMGLGLATGLFVKHMLPGKWQDIPLEQARLGIKRSIPDY